MKLRPYQERLIEDTRHALRRNHSVLMQAPTGAGKTAITVYMMGRAAENGKRAFFLVHQNELLGQTSRALWEQKLEHGVIASGKRVSKLPAQVASVQTLVNRLEQYEPPDLIIIDECHRSSANTYQRILDAYPNAMVIGLTATPQRTDGKGLNDTYSEMVQGPTIRQLINAGFLCDYEIYAPPNVLDVSSIKTKMGDYDKAQLTEAVDKPTITGDAVATYRKRAHGKRCVVMCISIAHAEHVCASYMAASVPAELIEGKMTNAERELTLNRFRSGETLVICNVQLLIEGVDIPSIEVVQWLRPTQSIIVWLQGNGRGLRPSEGKERLIILDQVGNWTKHGLPDDDREWSLEGKKGRKKKDTEEPDVFVQQCKACFHVFRPGVDICPGCGAPVERKKKPEIQVVDGDIEKIDIDAERKRKRVEQGKSRTLADLVALGARRQLRKPAEWACATLAAREGRKPTPAMYAEARQILRGINES